MNVLVGGTIAAVGASGVGALAIGLSGESDGGDAPGVGEETPEPDSGSDAPRRPRTRTPARETTGYPDRAPGAQTVRVHVLVVDENGDPVTDTPVDLVDRGGSGGTAAVTDGQGGAVFYEGVGPSPCNDLAVRLPAYDRNVGLGCHDGPERLFRRIRVGGTDGDPGATPRTPTATETPAPTATGTAEPTVTGTPASTATETFDAGRPPDDREVRIGLRLVDGAGDPVAGEPVRLVDRSGDDEQEGETGGDGVVVFYEGVGPSPCNRLVAVLPDRGNRTVPLGCHDGPETVAETVTVGD